MQPHIKEKLLREIWIWVQYFVISAITAIWAHDYYLSARYTPQEGVDALHLMSGLRSLWSGYFVPWFTAFLCLCALRFVFVFLFFILRGHTSKNLGSNLTENTKS